MPYISIPSAMRQELVADLQSGMIVTDAMRKYKYSRYKIRMVQQEEGLLPMSTEQVSITVPKFRCPCCGTLNTRKVRIGDRLCMRCIGSVD